jgi:hypothetical protein
VALNQLEYMVGVGALKVIQEQPQLAVNPATAVFVSFTVEQEKHTQITPRHKIYI